MKDNNAKEYSKYLEMPMTKPPAEIVNILERGPISTKLALEIHNVDELLSDEELPCEIGYCLFPDGTGYAAIETIMPGVTAEMIDWWFVWHSLDPIRYKIWNPQEHQDIYVLRSTLMHRLNMNLSFRERNWGTVDVVTENIGTGTIDICIQFLSPEEFGYDINKYNKSNIVTIVSSNGYIKEKNQSFEDAMPIMTSTGTYRQVEGGLVLRSRFWFGWSIVDKKPVLVNDNIELEQVKGISYHCMKEYNHLAKILPSVYYENYKKPIK